MAFLCSEIQFIIEALFSLCQLILQYVSVCLPYSCCESPSWKLSHKHSELWFVDSVHLLVRWLWHLLSSFWLELTRQVEAHFLKFQITPYHIPLDQSMAGRYCPSHFYFDLSFIVSVDVVEQGPKHQAGRYPCLISLTLHDLPKIPIFPC